MQVREEGNSGGGGKPVLDELCCAYENNSSAFRKTPPHQQEPAREARCESEGDAEDLDEVVQGRRRRSSSSRALSLRFSSRIWISDMTVTKIAKKAITAKEK